MYSSLYRSSRIWSSPLCWVVAILILAAGEGLAQGPEKITEVEGITEYRLDNGAKLLLFPDDSKPQFTMNMTVLVGSRHEGYGETGMAHLLEHMLFKGTDLHPDIPKLLKDRGVLNMNGTTWYDRTNYYETLPASDDNLEFAIRMEADRLLNSWIKAEHLASEMTVVRNEFERGENSPQRILFQRIMSNAYEWHNYGKSTIGNRSDIERVPVTNLRDFYRKYYQVDNIMLVIAGQFDWDKALEYVDKYFGSLKRPSRQLPQTYTEEPAQDGERTVMLRRVGDSQLVGLGYHIPAASHQDYAAAEVLETILGMEPSGPLYQQLVESKIASSISTMIVAGHDPGMLLAFAEVDDDGDLTQARKVLIDTVEQISRAGVQKDDVQRAVQRLLKQREMGFADSSRFAIDLSEWEAYGDWRLYFLHRDRLEKVTAEDVERVAGQFCVQSNRTVGMFTPTEVPVRAPVPSKPKLKEMLAGYQGRATIAEGEDFDPTPANIDRRTRQSALESGIQVATLAKKTRGERVFLQGQLHYGDQESLQGFEEACSMLPSLLNRGTKELDFQEFKDRLDQLRASISFGGDVGSLSFNVQTKRENLDAVLELLEQALRQPLLDGEEFDVLKRQQLTQMDTMKSDPQALAFNSLMRKMSKYPKGDVRYAPTIEENIQRMEALTIDQVQTLHREFLNGQHGEIAVVGDFDEQQTIDRLNRIFSGWKSDRAYTRIAEEPNLALTAERINIETPDKKNAIYGAAIPLQVRDDAADYEAMLIGNYIMGGGPLSSRLADRVRKKEGLSYTVASMFRADAEDESGMYLMFAISNPANTEKVVETIDEEVTRMLESGVTGDELERAKESYLQNRQGGRANDQRLASTLMENLKVGRTMSFYQASDDKISVLTKQQVDAAMKRYIDPEKMVIITAGDFASVEKTETSDKGDQ